MSLDVLKRLVEHHKATCPKGASMLTMVIALMVVNGFEGTEADAMLEKVRAVERARLRPKQQGQGLPEDEEPADPAIQQALLELAPAELQFLEGDVAADHALGEEDQGDGDDDPPVDDDPLADAEAEEELGAAMDLDIVDELDPPAPPDAAAAHEARSA
eukprot:14440429-Heterocapsa_arctica.AAC.1